MKTNVALSAARTNTQTGDEDSQGEEEKHRQRVQGAQSKAGGTSIAAAFTAHADKLPTAQAPHKLSDGGVSFDRPERSPTARLGPGKWGDRGRSRAGALPLQPGLSPSLFQLPHSLHRWNMRPRQVK